MRRSAGKSLTRHRLGFLAAQVGNELLDHRQVVVPAARSALIRVVASDCLTMYAMSRVRKRVLIGDQHGADLRDREEEEDVLGRLPSQRQTWSPVPTPAAISALAARSISARTAPQGPAAPLEPQRLAIRPALGRPVDQLAEGQVLVRHPTAFSSAESGRRAD